MEIMINIKHLTAFYSSHTIYIYLISALAYNFMVMYLTIYLDNKINIHLFHYHIYPVAINVLNKCYRKDLYILTNLWNV